MNDWLFALLGAAGGAVRGLIYLYDQVSRWRSDRRHHRARLRTRRTRAAPPKFSEYIDIVPEVVAGSFHAVLGAATGLLLGATGQITGAWAAIVVGVSAPALLTQLGRTRTIQNVVTGQNQQDAPSTESTRQAQVSDGI